MNGPNIEKRRCEDLAIFGGSALFAKPLMVGQPNIPNVDSVLADVRNVLMSGTLTNNGPYVRRFEEQIKRVSETDFCVATCNATAALELTARAMGLTGEVIVPSFTFIATAHALAWQGLTPVFVDVDATTHTIDPACVEAAITASTSAICGVHLWGNVCDVGALQSIADRHNLPLWFDASHALSAVKGGTKVGNFGKAEVFSFHATKFINSFEGGAVVTNDAALARVLREMRNFGFGEGHENEVLHLGINAKMTEVSAAMGIRSLEDLDRTRQLNRRNFYRCRELLEPCRGLRVSAPMDPEAANCQYMIVEVDETEARITRDSLLKILRAEGILAQRYFYPGCHQALPYRQAQLTRNWQLPVTEKLAQTVLVLPTGVRVVLEDIDRVCALIRFVVDIADDIQHTFDRGHA